MLVVVLTDLSAPSAFASDPFAAADEMYSQRENNHPKIEEARVAYLALLTSATATDGQKIRAATQLGRLAIYQGEMLFSKTDKESRKRVFRQCWETVAEKISPTVVGENSPFYLYKGVCLAYWAEAVGTIPSLPYLPTLINILKKIDDSAHPEFKSFEGGGLYRLAGGVHSNPIAHDFPGNLYNPTQALQEANEAIATLGVQDPVTHKTLTGSDFYENFLAVARVYLEMNKLPEAKLAYQRGIDVVNAAIDADNVPEGRVAETNWIMNTMTTELAAMH